MAMPERNASDINVLRRKVAWVRRRLVKRFGTPEWKGPSDPLESIIETILSQNTNDVNRDRAYRSLRKSFPRWEMLLDAPTKEIADAIRVGGLANQKSRRIKDFLTWVKAEYGRMNLDGLCDMSAQEAVEVFTRHKGIGMKTIYVTLLFACGTAVFPVDTHIYRIVRRLEIAPERASRDQVTAWMQALVREEDMFPFHINLIHFGREVCKAQRPLCYLCELATRCGYPEKTPAP